MNCQQVTLPNAGNTDVREETHICQEAKRNVMPGFGTTVLDVSHIRRSVWLIGCLVTVRPWRRSFGLQELFTCHV